MTIRIQHLLPAMTALALCAAASGEIPLHAAPAAPDISGVYWTTTYNPRVQPMTGGDLPYKPDAMAQYKKNIADIAAGKLDDMARSYCLPDGVPRVTRGRSTTTARRTRNNCMSLSALS